MCLPIVYIFESANHKMFIILNLYAIPLSLPIIIASVQIYADALSEDCLCLIQDPSVTDVACAALNGLKVGDKTLTVRRATVR